MRTLHWLETNAFIVLTTFSMYVHTLHWRPLPALHANVYMHLKCRYFHVNFGLNTYLFDWLHGTQRKKDRIYGEDIFGGKGKAAATSIVDKKVEWWQIRIVKLCLSSLSDTNIYYNIQLQYYCIMYVHTNIIMVCCSLVWILTIIVLTRRP